MTDWFEFATWIVGLLLVHEGLALWTQGRRSGLVQAIPFVGAIIIFVGAGLWYWDSQASRQLANVLQAPPVTTKAAMQTEDFEKLPRPQRKDLSIRLAKAVFVSGGELVDVANDEGLWIPYSPSADDIKARDRQIKTILELDTRREELITKAQIAENYSRRWLISLIVVICAGLIAGRLRSRITRS